LPGQRGDGDGGDIPNEDRRTIGFAAEDDSLDVFDSFQEGDAADKPLLSVVDDVAATRCLVVFLDTAKDVFE